MITTPEQQPEQPVIAPVDKRPDSPKIRALREDLGHLLGAINGLGAQVDMGMINTAAQANAACVMFVQLGLVTPEQMDELILEHAKGILAASLQQVEEARLAMQQQERQLQVVEKPKLLVAKH